MVSLEKSHLLRVTFIFVPGHAGVMGNERADQLAGLAHVSAGQAMDRSDILNALKDEGRVNEGGDDCDSATMARLYELRIERGLVRRERYRGRQRRLVNQHRTGTISRYTLRDLLEMRSSHLWTLFNEDDLLTTKLTY